MLKPNDEHLRQITPGFSLRNLGVLCYNAGFTVWYYNGSSDELSTILEPNFFKPAADLICELDVVLVTSKEKTTSSFYFANGPKGEVLLKTVNDTIFL